jgi:hypothetical protein
MGDQHSIHALEALARIGTGRIAHHPRIDEHGFAAGQGAEHRRMAQPGKAGPRVLIGHDLPSLS